MTFCNVLKEGITEHGRNITAYRCIDKYSVSDRYEVVVSENSIAIWFERCAKTTWKKKFSAMQREY